ncbi:MAG: class I SAM-dependent methyltransferase [Chloroflexota bacterium]
MPSPPDHYTHIYSSQAAAYHQLIAAEDIDGNLLPALNNVAGLSNAHLLDIGTGTGRIPLLVHPHTSNITALDLHADMLHQQALQRQRVSGTWPLLQSDMRRIPLPSNHFDVITAGWAIGHFMSWFGDEALNQITLVLNEMMRVCKPGGTLIILETLTTGSHTPAPPTENLAKYYGWLENEWGFTRQVIQTDYQFQSIEEAIAVTEFFFGPELSAKIRMNNWSRLPEWTGMWSKTTAN